MSVNHVSIEGRLCYEPETRYTNGGMCICSFSVANNKRVKDSKSGDWKDSPTTFKDCKAWGKIGEAVAVNCRKGSAVLVVGSVETEEWQKDGETKRKEVINATAVYLAIRADRPSDGLDFAPTQEKPVAASVDSFGGGSDVSDDVPF